MSVESPRVLEGRVVLELGTGVSPFPENGNRAVGKGEHYIGVELEEKLCPGARRALNFSRERHSGKTDIVCADARYLPLSNGSVSEVIVCNVFGYLALRPRIPGLINECKRVLEERGKLIVVETITPRDAPLNFVRRFLRRKSFTLIDKGADVHSLSRIREYKSRYPSGNRQNRHFGEGYVAAFGRDEDRNVQRPQAGVLIDILAEMLYINSLSSIF